MIIDGGQVEAEGDLELRFGQQLPHILLDLVQAVHLLLIGEEHVRVDLVNEHFVLYVFVDARAGLNDISELLAVAFVVLRLGVNHKDQGATILDRCHILWRTAPQIIIPWEVLDCELNVWVIIDEYGLYLCCGREEEGLMRGQLLEYDTRYRSFT